MIDPDGFRPNVGIVLVRNDDQVFWARRISRDGWQFPQGGMRSDETPREAMYRELREETGLLPEHVEVLGATPGWLKYRLPERLRRSDEKLPCLGQNLCLDVAEQPEFDAFRWVDFWYPPRHVVHFKRHVYKRALRLLEPLLPETASPQSS